MNKYKIIYKIKFNINNISYALNIYIYEIIYNLLINFNFKI